MKKEGLEKGKITFGGMMAQDAKEPEEIKKIFCFCFLLCVHSDNSRRVAILQLHL